MAKRRKASKKKKKNSLVTVDNLTLIAPPRKKREGPDPLKMSNAEMRLKLERELRRYVKRAGGLRKGHEKNKTVIARVKALCKVLGRDASSMKKVKWDFELHIDGYDNPSVKNMIIAD